MTMRILGITDEINVCECCGRVNLKCTVALDRCDGEGNATGDIVHYGRDCAAKAILGNNKTGSIKIVEATAKAVAYCQKWLRKTPAHTAAIVARGCRVFCPCWTVGEEIHFDNGIVVR